MALVPSKNKANKELQGVSEDKRGSDNTSLGGKAALKPLQAQPAQALGSLGLPESPKGPTRQGSNSSQLFQLILGE